MIEYGMDVMLNFMFVVNQQQVNFMHKNIIMLILIVLINVIFRIIHIYINGLKATQDYIN